MKVGDKVKVVEYPDGDVVGMKGVVTRVPEDDDPYFDVSLFAAPHVDRPFETDFLFFEQELEIIS